MTSSPSIQTSNLLYTIPYLPSPWRFDCPTELSYESKPVGRKESISLTW